MLYESFALAVYWEEYCGKVNGEMDEEYASLEEFAEEFKADEERELELLW